MATSEAIARRALGWGAAAPLLSAGDLVRDIALVPREDGSLDLACVAGPANLGQDLALALTTRLGADPLDSGFGFDGMTALVVETSTTMVRERLRASVAKLVARDPRVRSVNVVEIDDAVSLATRTLSLRVEVNTIVGSGASLATVLPG